MSENGERNQLVTIAYNSTTGVKKWGKRATEDFEDNVIGLAVDTTNHQVYSLTEPLDDAEIDLTNQAVTLGFSSSGDRAWRATHSSPSAGSGVDMGAIATDASRGQVYVCGAEIPNSSDSSSVVTIGYTA